MRVVQASGDFNGLGEGVAARSPRMASPWMGAARMPTKALRMPAAQGCWGVGPRLSPIRREVSTLFQPGGVLDMRVCGQPGSPPCDAGSAVSPLSGLGRVFPLACQPIRELLSEFETLLASSAFKSLDEATRESIKAIYEEADRISTLTYLNPFGDTCARNTATLKGHLETVRAEMRARNLELPASVSRALDVVPVPDSGGVPVLVKVALGVGVVAMGLVAVGYAVRSFR